MKLDHREKLAAQKLAEVVDNAAEVETIDLPSLMPRVVDNEMDGKMM